MVLMGWLIDLALLAALTATLVQATRLRRLLGLLKAEQAALQGPVDSLGQAASQAQLGIERLREASESRGKELASLVSLAAAQRDDLAYLVERGERLAMRIEVSLQGGRHMSEGPRHAGEYITSPKTPPVAVKPKDFQVGSKSERDLILALREAK